MLPSFFMDFCYKCWEIHSRMQQHEKNQHFFFFFFSYQKLGVRLIHVCAVYTRLYGNENIRKCTFFWSCYCRAEKYGFPQQNTDFGVWEYWKAQIQLGSSVSSRSVDRSNISFVNYVDKFQFISAPLTLCPKPNFVWKAHCIVSQFPSS